MRALIKISKQQAKEYKVSFISSICSEAGMLTSAYVSDELKIPTLVNYETINAQTNHQ